MTPSRLSQLTGQVGGAAAGFLGGPAGLAAAGILGTLAIGGAPKPPDLVGEAVGRARSAQQRLSRQASRESERLQGDLAAAGATGSQGVGAREALQRATLDATAGLAGDSADSVARARNEQQRIAFEQRARMRRARLGALGQGLSALALQSALKPTEEPEEDPRLANLQDRLTEANKMLASQQSAAVDSAAAESGVPGVTPLAADLTAVDELRLDLSGIKPRRLFPAPWQRSGLIP